MAQIVTALFDGRASAESARDRLVASGIGPERISLLDKSAAPEGTRAEIVAGHLERGYVQAVRDLFLPEEDARAYQEGVHRGGVLLSVRLEGRDPAEVVRILEGFEPVDLDRRQAEWRQAGGGTVAGSGMDPSAGVGAGMSQTETMPGTGQMGLAMSALGGASDTMGSTEAIRDAEIAREMSDRASRTDASDPVSSMGGITTGADVSGFKPRMGQVTSNPATVGQPSSMGLTPDPTLAAKMAPSPSATPALSDAAEALVRGDSDRAGRVRTYIRR